MSLPVTKGDPTIDDAPFFQKTPNVHCHSVDESTIEDKDLTNLLSGYCKHVRGRSTDACREPMKGDPTINDVPLC